MTHRHAANVGSHLALSARTYPHGTRGCYVQSRCRCFNCRRANSAYYHQRKADPRISAEPVRLHLSKLSAQGIGLRSVSDVTDIARVALKRVQLGQPRIRASNAEKILAVDEQAIADHGLVDATETRRLIRELVADGYPQARLAQLLGHERLALQYKGDRVLAKTAQRIRKLHAELLAESDEVVELAPEDSPRLRILAAIRLFAEVEAQVLFDAMGVEARDRDAYMQAIHRLWKSGALERHGAGKPYRYSLEREVAARVGRAA